MSCSRDPMQGIDAAHPETDADHASLRRLSAQSRKPRKLLIDAERPQIIAQRMARTPKA